MLSAMLTTNLSYGRLLVPVDFSETARKAFYHAVGYAKHFGVPLTVLHVREDEDEGEGEAGLLLSELEQSLRKRLDDLEQDQRLSRDQIDLRVRTGKPWLEILRCAVELDVDLIIMGTHGHTGFKHIFMGSQCERVVRRAPCDVLVVKPDGYAPDIDLG